MAKSFMIEFLEFWNIYPCRNGRKIGKSEAQRKFFLLSAKHRPLLIQATKNYVNSQDVKNGIGIKDPHRFIKDGYGGERWREYIGNGAVKPKKVEEPPEREFTLEERCNNIRSYKEIMKKTIEDIKKKKGE